MEHELKEIIRLCDQAIRNEDFDALMEFYTDDAVLVVKPGMTVKGKEKIRKAFVAIAEYFNNSIVPVQGPMVILETCDTALVLSQTLLTADREDNEFSMDRKATYVFRKNPDGKWLCAIDNSYGTDIIPV